MKVMSKQTAVEWLYFQLIKQINPHGDTGQLWETLQKAKAMEREQMIKFADDYEQYAYNASYNGKRINAV